MDETSQTRDISFGVWQVLSETAGDFSGTFDTIEIKASSTFLATFEVDIYTLLSCGATSNIFNTDALVFVDTVTPINDQTWHSYKFTSTAVTTDPTKCYIMRLNTAGGGPWQFKGSIDQNAYPYGDLTNFIDTSPIKDLYFIISATSTSFIGITAPQQFKSDATSTIAEGGTTTEDTVVFRAIIQSSSTNPLKLEVEYTTSTFSGVANATSSLVNPGQFAIATASGLQDGSYRWQARAVDTVTNTASNWQEFGTGGNVDFVVHQVPLYTQVRSPFPSDEETQRWFDKIYANGLGSTGDNPCGLFIQNCGCAITSVVMILRYYGIATGTDNQDVNPLALNNWLSNNNGYVGSGNINWVKISEYSKDPLSGLARLHYDGRRDVGDNLGTTFNDLTLVTDSYVNSAKPVIVWIPDFGHFLVTNEKLATTYAVRDPAWYNTKTLNDGFTSSIQRIRSYNNQFEGVRLYSYLSGPIDGIYLNLASPAELLITDPQGRRLGRDPIASIIYNEIPNGSYGRDGISNAETEITNPPHIIKSILIPEPVPGSYEIKVAGTASGTYSLSSLVYDINSMPHSVVFSGTTAINEEDNYILSFSTSTPADISIREVYKFLGFLPPIKSDDSGVYKLNRTLPIKFQLKDANDQIVGNATATLTIARVQDGIVGVEEIPLSTSVAGTGNIFRYDSENNQYVYNLNTGTMSRGTWRLKVALDDGKNYTVLISLRD